MDVQILQKYRHAFGKLRRRNGLAPHKPILLLSVLDEIGRGHITDNAIILTRELVAAFDNYWEGLPPPPGVWHKRIYTPYHRLVQEGFWHLFRDGHQVNAEEVDQPYSIPHARSVIHYVRLDEDLWQLLQDAVYRAELHAHLLHVYYGVSPSQVQPFVTSDQIAIQIDKLIAEAQSKPKPKVPKSVKEEGDEAYMRRELFRDVIYKVYDNTCAACGLKVRVGSSRVLAASHIRQFSLFGDNHPSNGLALCHNHHWAFDRGGFSISDDYKLLVSPKMTGTPSFVSAGFSLYLPLSPKCYPDPAALAWHRDNRFQK